MLLSKVTCKQVIQEAIYHYKAITHKMQAIQVSNMVLQARRDKNSGEGKLLFPSKLNAHGRDEF